MRLAELGDAIDLLAPTAGATQVPGAECGQLAGPRAGARDRPPRARAGLDALDEAGLLEAGECRIQRPERDPGRSAAGRAAGQFGEALAQLVAVQVLLLEEPEDGEVDHSARDSSGS